MSKKQLSNLGLAALAVISIAERRWKQRSTSVGRLWARPIGVRDGGAAAPPIRAVCRHEFGQRGDIIRAKHNTCLNNTNLGSVTAVTEKKKT